MGWLPGTGALRERQFRLLFIGQSVSILGDAMSGVALTFAVLEIGGSASQLGLVARPIDERLELLGRDEGQAGPLEQCSITVIW